jgi:intracellular sulfur oxidation DsrE/DsrF family protein
MEKKEMTKENKTTIISCYNDGEETNTSIILPVGFGWINDLLELKTKNKLIVLLHGACLKYGLRNSVYEKKFNTVNPFKKLLKGWVVQDISIKICNLCLTQNGYSAPEDILPFIETVPFSIQYLINQQSKGKDSSIVIYDAPAICS